MRSADHLTIEADDPIAPGELAALAAQQGWSLEALGKHRFALRRQNPSD